ncbi:hypothetical protein JCM8202_004117 [Rhodotorula sphaerocarpa]
MSLRKHQTNAYWREVTKEDLFRQAFGLPDDEEPLGEVHAMLFMAGNEEAHLGKLYLSTSFLTFSSLDRRSCRLTLPLATIRRVEKLAPGQEGTTVGAFALALTLFHGLRIIVQLNSLRPTNDQFCSNLRVRLKASLPLMKALKPFSGTFFSEYFLSDAHTELEKAGAQETGKVDELISFDDKGKGKEADEPWTTESGTKGFHTGLGIIFKFPGDPRKLREKSKMKLWKAYLEQYGRNLTLIRYPAFTRLVLVGLPNRLRGEIWELTCGSMFLRLQNPGVYAQILEDNAGRRSASTDDIEKDLHRSLPEYPAYQETKGIDTMRRVLTAYAWSNPALGYCQAMNLIVASFLVYMSEEQCFWCLTVLCDRLLPGYYSPSMYGTVLDQRVFEHLVSRCLPSLHEHFVRTDIQLSVASLPWFLSLYISSMPMIFAFRIIDCFFLMGPKVLFQVGLAILKLNGPELLECTDDGAFINILKDYFTTLGDPAHPNARDAKQRQVTKFQELFVVAFREFANVSDETITTERKRFRSEVLVSIETFAKRTALRNLRSNGRLNPEQLALAYDHFQLAALQQKESERVAALGSRSRASSSASRKTPRSPNLASSTSSFSSETRPVREDAKVEERLGRHAFGKFIADIATWARDEKTVKNGLLWHIERQPKDHVFVDRIFTAWDTTGEGSLSLQDVVNGLDSVLFNDLMQNVAWLFSVYDADHDGFLTKDEILQVSEALLFIFRNEPGDRYLGSVSNLLQNLFEYGETTKPALPEGSAPADDDQDRPFLALATFRMCILTDALLEEFFESDLTQSWRLEVLVPEEKPKAQSRAGGWWGGIMEAVMTDENKERFNRLADEVGKRLDIHSEEHRPSIGKLDAAAAAIEPQARGTLFSTSNARKAPASPATPEAVANPLSAAAMRMPAYPTSENPWAAADGKPDSAAPLAPQHDIDVQALAQQAALQRPQFAVDEATEGEGEEWVGGEGGEGGEVDEGLLGQVDAMLQAEPAGAARPYLSNAEEIIKELEQIGRERFKVAANRYHLPPGTIQLVIDLTEPWLTRVSASSAEKATVARRPRSSSNREMSVEVRAAGALINMARRGSADSNIPAVPRAPALSDPNPQGRNRVFTYGSVPSRREAAPRFDRAGPAPATASVGNVSPFSGFSFDRTHPAPSAIPLISPRSACIALPRLPALPSPPPPRSFPHASAPPPLPAALVQVARPPSPLARPMSALATSTSRMSIEHITSPTTAAAAALPLPPPPPPPHPASSSSAPRFEMPPPSPSIRTMMPTSAIRHSRSRTEPKPATRGGSPIKTQEGLTARRPTV